MSVRKRRSGRNTSDLVFDLSANHLVNLSRWTKNGCFISECLLISSCAMCIANKQAFWATYQGATQRTISPGGKFVYANKHYPYCVNQGMGNPAFPEGHVTISDSYKINEQVFKKFVLVCSLADGIFLSWCHGAFIVGMPVVSWRFVTGIPVELCRVLLVQYCEARFQSVSEFPSVHRWQTKKNWRQMDLCHRWMRKGSIIEVKNRSQTWVGLLRQVITKFICR